MPRQSCSEVLILEAFSLFAEDNVYLLETSSTK